MNSKLITPGDVALLEGLSGGEYNSAAGLVSFVRRGPGARTRIILMDVITRAEREITAGGKREDEPRLSPDGRTLALISDGCLVVMSVAGGEPRTLAPAAHGAIWSPRGDMLLFLAETPAEGQISPDGAVAIEDFGYKFDGAGFVALSQTHIWTVSLAGGEPKQLTFGKWDDMLPTWTPDGETIVFASGRARSKRESIAADLFTISASGGEPRRISTLGAVVCYPIPFRPLVTPDGQYVVAAYLPESADDPRHEKGLPLSRLMRVRIDGSEQKDIWDEAGAAHECVAFPYNASGARAWDRAQISSDGKCAYFLAGRDGRTELYGAQIFGEPCVSRLSCPNGSFMGLGAPQGGKMLAAYSGADAPGEYYLLDEASFALDCRLTFGNAFLRERGVLEPREIWFDTLDGAGRVQGWAIAPLEHKPGEKYPAILYIHGGPHPYYTPCFDLELQAIAAAGFAVLFCNPRGSSGYGGAHLDSRQAFDGRAYMDVLQFVSEACRAFDFIDSARVGATGGSYGGYMVNYIATHSKRFRCFVTQRSITNELISYACSDMQGSSEDYESFLDFMKAQLDKSAVTRASEVDAPMLIMHGMDDLRCPVEGAHQWFVALKDTHRDLPVRLMLWPGLAHGIPSAPASRERYYTEIINWFKNYL